MTIIVVLSGFVGRYLLNQIGKEIREKKATLATLESAYSRLEAELARNPELLQLIRSFSEPISRMFTAFLLPSDTRIKRGNSWQRMTMRGLLSAAQRHLEKNCSSCHVPVRGADPARCIYCHANDERILRRQETSFHAGLGTCNDCHREHQGRSRDFTRMDHATLSRLGLRRLGTANSQNKLGQVRNRFLMWMDHADEDAMPHPCITKEEIILDCAGCHSGEDPHVGYFGDDCASCHSTRSWTIPEYLHPSSLSTDCNPCHKAPTSHFMPMFTTMCASMLGKFPKSVDECYVCHEITAWNDKKGAPWHKETMSHIPFRLSFPICCGKKNSPFFVTRGR